MNFIERDISKVALIDALDENGNLTLAPAPNRFPQTETGGQFGPVGPDEFLFFRFDEQGQNLTPFGDIDVIGLGSFNAGFGLPDGSAELGNLNGFSNLQLPQERESFKGKVSYEFENVEIYADVYYSKSDVPYNFGGPLQGFPTAFPFRTSFENNPFWSDQTIAQMSGIYQVLNFFVPQIINISDENQNGIIDAQIRFS